MKDSSDWVKQITPASLFVQFIKELACRSHPSRKKALKALRETSGDTNLHSCDRITSSMNALLRLHTQHKNVQNCSWLNRSLVSKSVHKRWTLGDAQSVIPKHTTAHAHRRTIRVLVISQRELCWVVSVKWLWGSAVGSVTIQIWHSAP